MRLDNLLSDWQPDRNDRCTDIHFIIEGQPFEMFGQTFESLQEAAAYADEHDIPYTKERSVDFTHPDGTKEPTYSYQFQT